jgi:Putative transposase
MIVAVPCMKKPMHPGRTLCSRSRDRRHLQQADWRTAAGTLRPFAGPEQVLAYLSRYTHRVAISNSRLIAAGATGVTFRYKDHRIKGPG